MKNINFVVSIIVIAFVATGLAVVPALELANANPDTELLKKGGNGKGKGKCGACGDYIIDEPVIKLLKGGNNKNHDKQHHHQNH